MNWDKPFGWLKEWAQPIAIIVGGIWIASVWSYQNIYLPSLVQEHVSIAAQAKIVDEQDAYFSAILEVEIVNRGKTPAFNANNSINVFGYTVRRQKNEFSESFVDLAVETLNNSVYPKIFLDSAEISAPQLVAFGNFMVKPERFEPNERYQIQKPLVFPKGFDFVEIKVEVIHSKNELQNFPNHAYRKDGRLGMDLSFDGLESLQRSEARTIVFLSKEIGQQVQPRSRQ